MTRQTDMVMTFGRLVARGLGVGLLLATLCMAGCATPSINNQHGEKGAFRRAAAGDSFPTAAQAGIPSTASAD